MLNLARKRLGLKCVKARVIFEAIAKEFGLPDWAGTKPQGYDLVYQYIAIHKGTPVVGTPKAAKPFTATKDFLETYEWRALRMRVLTARGARCECCGATPKDGVRMHVDHIKPRLKFPELALVESNLQILCEVCNHGKGNWDETDWRTPADPLRPRLVKRSIA